ncbi:MAG: hypothetical protein ACR2MT_16780 [Aurantibacter sp.]
MRSLLKIIFIITLLELFVAGGGRVFEIGGATLRMALFFLNIIIACVMYVYRASIPQYVVVLLGAAFVVLLFYAGLGWFNGAPFASIAEDVKPLSYFFSILFFSYYIDRKERVQLVVSLIKKSSLFLAIVYILIQAGFFLGRIDFMWFYNYANTQISPSDFIFRGTQGLFFYKGFIYMVVGLIFWIHSEKSRSKNISILLIMAAMILTGTRGFILMFVFLYALVYGIPILMRLNVKVLILVALLAIGSIYFFGNFEIGDKALSDSIRIQQLVQVAERINPLSFFIGHGFGVGVPIREVHMEIAYLEVFHKQGILGLWLWGLFFLFLYHAYVRATNFLNVRKAFFLSVCFVLLVSFVNPIFNNPIGISLFMIALASLHVLNRLAKKSMPMK